MSGLSIQSIVTQARAVIHRFRLYSNGPRIDHESIMRSLQQLEFIPPKLLLVHSSCSACGYLIGGTTMLIQLLTEWNRGGTLVMPAHSYCYPDEHGIAPIFDAKTSSSHVGALTDAFRRQPGVFRSIHPTHSIAAVGPEAQWLIKDHESTATPCGAGTPYEKLVQRNASVLMFGVTMESYTLFHTAEAEAAVPYLYSPHPVSLQMRGPDSSIRPMKMRRQDMSVARRFAEMDTWLEQQGLLHRIPCGSGQLLWLPHSRDVHRTLVAALKADPWMLVAPSARPTTK